jgi:hypothetical protein
MRKGMKRNGVAVAMIMPSGFYEIMTDRDLDAVIAYLHTIKLIKNTVPDPVYKMAQGHPIPPGGDKPFTDAILSDKLKKGFYLVTIAHCMECHTPMGPRGREFETKLGTGGFEFPGPWGVSEASRCRVISLQAKTRVSVAGPTMKSSARSPKASAATAAS